MENPYILLLYLNENKIGTLYSSIIPRVGEYINLRNGKDIEFGGNKLFQIKK